jgi:hypothetical protein
LFTISGRSHSNNATRLLADLRYVIDTVVRLGREVALYPENVSRLAGYYISYIVP